MKGPILPASSAVDKTVGAACSRDFDPHRGCKPLPRNERPRFL